METEVVNRLPYPYGIKIIKEREEEFTTFTAVVLDMVKVYDAERDLKKNTTEKEKNTLYRRLSIVREQQKIMNNGLINEDYVVEYLINTAINSSIAYGLQYIQGWDSFPEKEIPSQKDYPRSRLLDNY